MSIHLHATRQHLRRIRRLLVVASASLGIGLWLAFAPTSLGGSATYVTTYGTSMEPTLHRGDLAVVRAQRSYRVGDVVAYRSDSLQTVVLHRIIGREGDRFVLKGDNNTWTDADRPAAAQVVGKMEVRVPGLGNKLQRVASPTGIATLAGMAAFPVGAAQRTRRRKARATVNPASIAGGSSPVWGPIDQRLVMAGAIAAVLAAVAFGKPLNVSGSNDVPFEERGEFSYTAAVPGASAAYPSGAVETGQPVFLNLVTELEVAFDYTTSSTEPVAVDGVLRLGAEVRDTNGWRRPLELGSVATVTADGGRASGSLDLQEIRAAVADMEAATGVHRNAYTVSVRALTTRQARFVDAVDDGSFTASVDFELTDLELRVVDNGAEPFAPSQGSLLSVPVERQNHLALLDREVPIAALRAVALALLVLVGAAWLDWLVRGSRGDEASRIARRYRSYLLPVRALDTEGSAIEVTSIDDLAKLADRVGTPILHDPAGTYQVVDGDQVYRHSLTMVAG